jgi:hypothetical protein
MLKLKQPKKNEISNFLEILKILEQSEEWKDLNNDYGSMDWAGLQMREDYDKVLTWLRNKVNPDSGESEPSPLVGVPDSG